jgi:hypothetical protein
VDGLASHPCRVLSGGRESRILYREILRNALTFSRGAITVLVRSAPARRCILPAERSELGTVHIAMYMCTVMGYEVQHDDRILLYIQYLCPKYSVRVRTCRYPAERYTTVHLLSHGRSSNGCLLYILIPVSFARANNGDPSAGWLLAILATLQALLLTAAGRVITHWTTLLPRRWDDKGELPPRTEG